MRDILVSLFVVGSLPTCFRRPFIGLLMFTLLAYMRVQDMTWGWARFQRWSFLVAVVTLAGFLISKTADKRFMLPDIRCWTMVGLAVLVGASLVLEGSYDLGDFARYVEFCKIIGVALFTTGVVRNREYLRILVWTIALSLGFFGVKNGLHWLLTGGSLIIYQGPGGMMLDNNDFALALGMGVPMLLHLGLAERRPLLRRTVIAMVPLTVATIAATHSRGGFLALAAAILVLVWRSQNRVAGFAMLILAAGAGWLAMPQSYKERIASIGSYSEDKSALGRLAAWKVAGRMILANPMLGVGFDKFQVRYKRYDPDNVFGDETDAGTARVAHNSYLQIWAECGTPAFLLYLLLIGLSLLDVWRIRRMACQRYHSSWILSYATMFEAALAAFVVGSVFLNRAHFDLFYHFVAVVAVFGVIAREQMQDPQAYPVKDERVGARRRRAPGARGFGVRPALGGA